MPNAAAARASTIASQSEFDATADGGIDRVTLVYNAFKSVLEQKVTDEQLLPIPRRIIADDDDVDGNEPSITKALAFFEPEAKDFLERLLPTYLDTTIYRALLESAAAELAAAVAARALDRVGRVRLERRLRSRD